MMPCTRHLTIIDHREWCLTNLSSRLRDDTHRSATCLRWASQTLKERWYLTSSKGGNAALTTFPSRCGQRYLTTRASTSSRLVGWWYLTAVGDNIPVKLNIGWDRITAIRRAWRELFKRAVLYKDAFIPVGGWSVSAQNSNNALWLIRIW